MIRLRRVLVAVDFHQRSQEALLYGIQICKDRNARLYLLHVLDQQIIEAIQQVSRKGYKGDILQGFRKVVKDREEDLRKLIPEKLTEEIEVELLVRKGEPADEIISIAREHLIDLLILGSQGQEADKSKHVGKVAQASIKGAPCPVLLVRPLANAFPE